MATIIAAGAASCAGYFIGSLAMRGGSRGRGAAHPHPSLAQRANRPRFVQSAVPRSFFMTAPAPPVPRRALPGQCLLCESWFQHGDVVAKLYCGHVYHRACLDTVCRQPTYENFRCTCPQCNGLSWVTRFAVTELRKPAEPSVAPLNMPSIAPTVRASQAPAAVQPPLLRQPPPARPRPPQSPHNPPAREPPQSPHRNLPIATTATAAQTEESSREKEEDQEPLLDHAVDEFPALPEVKEETTPFCLHTPPARLGGYPSCTLCPCNDCGVGGDGNCSECGRCLCYACTYDECECCCRCVVQYTKK